MANYELITIPYNREEAVAYADYWAYRRNPKYYAFDEIGGDCTNFVSQAVFAGSGVMNFTPTYGWFYLNLNERAPAWTGVEYFYNFMTQNKGPGPFGRETPLNQLQPGDAIQLMLGDRTDFGHTVIVMSIEGEEKTPDTIRVAAHDRDCNCRPLSTYNYSQLRAIHLEGVRYFSLIGEPEPASPLAEEERPPLPKEE